MISIDQSTLEFLSKLKKNNNRDWFAKNKTTYTKAHDNFKTCIAACHKTLDEIDKIDNSKVFRIYRDVRFGKDKTPYKTNFGASFSRLGKYRRGGFYVQIAPGNCFFAGGFWKPNKQDLAYIRAGISSDPAPLRDLLSNSTFVSHFNSLQGDQLKRAPKGFPVDHPEIDLLRFKQFLVVKPIKDQDVLSSNFVPLCVQTYTAMIPFFDIIRDYLVYDLNGEERF